MKCVNELLHAYKATPPFVNFHECSVNLSPACSQPLPEIIFILFFLDDHYWIGLAFVHKWSLIIVRRSRFFLLPHFFEVFDSPGSVITPSRPLIKQFFTNFLSIGKFLLRINQQVWTSLASPRHHLCGHKDLMLFLFVVQVWVLLTHFHGLIRRQSSIKVLDVFGVKSFVLHSNLILLTAIIFINSTLVIYLICSLELYQRISDWHWGETSLAVQAGTHHCIPSTIGLIRVLQFQTCSLLFQHIQLAWIQGQLPFLTWILQ